MGYTPLYKSFALAKERKKDRICTEHKLILVCSRISSLSQRRTTIVQLAMTSDDGGVAQCSKFYNPKAKNVLMKNYKEEFEPSVYLKYYEASNPSEISFFLKQKFLCFHESFLTVPNGVKVLDYGAGPTITLAISSATKASEIVLADYCEKNLKFINGWLNYEADAFDWSPYFAYVVQELEGKGEKEVKEREQIVRKLIKAVVPCDINNDPPIEQGFDTLYDVVMCSLVMEGASNTIEEYCRNIARLGQLVKPGGSVFYYGVEDTVGYYTIGERNFPSLHVTDELVLTAFRDAGFRDVSLKQCDVGDPYGRFKYLTGKRN